MTRAPQPKALAPLLALCLLAAAPADRRDPCELSPDAKLMALRVGQALLDTIANQRPSTQAAQLIVKITDAILPPECKERPSR